MLIYHPAYDAYHCTIRMVALLTITKTLDIEKARILDFYLAFPGTAASMRFPSEMTSLRRDFMFMRNVYRDPVSAKRTFMEMRHVQLSALGCLAAAGIVYGENLQAGIVARTGKGLPNVIDEAVNGFIKQEKNVLAMLTQHIANIRTAGPNGLKDRSELLEYRYDPVQADNPA